jgi:hypothetical protein
MPQHRQSQHRWPQQPHGERWPGGEVAACKGSGKRRHGRTPVINLTSFVCLVLPCPLWSRPKVRWVTLQGSHPMRGNKELSSSTAKQTGLSDLGVRTEVQFYSVGLQTQSGRTFQDTSTTNRRLLSIRAGSINPLEGTPNVCGPHTPPTAANRVGRWRIQGPSRYEHHDLSKKRPREKHIPNHHHARSVVRVARVC